MAWDKNLPDGDADIAVGDDDIRTNNDALETALKREHIFATGAGQTGRHRFSIGTNAARDADPTGYANGSIHFSNDEISGNHVLQLRASGVFENVDVNPGNLPRTDSRSQFDILQYGLSESVVPASGSPDTLAVNFSGAPYKHAIITGDTQISNPSGAYSPPYLGSVRLQLTMDGAGHVITFGTAYRASNGFSPVINSDNNAVNLLTITQLNTGAVLVTSLPDIKVIT